MPYSSNPKYNTRNSGRYNTPGQFVPGGEMNAASQPPLPPQRPTAASYNTATYTKQPPLPQQQANTYTQQNSAYVQQQNLATIEPAADVDMNNGTDVKTERPPWMKSKLTGVTKKISNKERRRRQNKNLRRLLSPKNALMVLNEMMPGVQILNQFKVEAVDNQGNYKSVPVQYAAELVLDGEIYRGYGVNKNAARNAVAEQAIRNLMVKQLSKAADPAKDVEMDGEEDDSLPMMQLASYALHKLFAEWEMSGVKVPQLRPNAVQPAEPENQQLPVAKTPKVKPRKVKEVPENASTMHPSMLLTYMRPGLEYRELEVIGDKPQNMTFTIGVEVDGFIYSGKAANKKEARKAAARAACEALYGVHFDDSKV